MTVEDLGKARPDLRNPLLATMSEFLLKTENRYSGILTIRREMKLAGLYEPQFVNKRNEFVVILYNDHDMKPEIKQGSFENVDTKNILEFCKVPRTRKEIAEYLGIDTIFYVTKNYIQPLVDTGMMELTIPDKPKSKKQKYYTQN